MSSQSTSNGIHSLLLGPPELKRLHKFDFRPGSLLLAIVPGGINDKAIVAS